MTTSNVDVEQVTQEDVVSEAEFIRRLQASSSYGVEGFKALENWCSQFGKVIRADDNGWFDGVLLGQVTIEMDGDAGIHLMLETETTFEPVTRWDGEWILVTHKIHDRSYFIRMPEE